MSYILEALKKAQAERQLGSAPTIHAPPVAAAPASSAMRVPLLAGGAAVVVLAAAGLFIWQRQGMPVAEAGSAQLASATVPRPAASPAPGSAGPIPASGQVATTAPQLAKQEQADRSSVAPTVAERAATAPDVAPATAAGPAVAASSAQVALVGRPDAPAKPAAAAAAARVATNVNAPAPGQAAVASAQRVAGPAVMPSPTRVAAQPAPAATASVNPDEALGGVNTLPDAVRASVPKVTFGGYMYSPNPADRLVLADNVLRREGEEVAPGLVLEKLLPKGAVLNYRGYRYRVAF